MMGPTLTAAIETHGCKLNQADSQALARRLLQAGFRLVTSDTPADVYILNSCTVTHIADSKARQAMRAARRRNPHGLVVVTGCYAQRSRADISGLGDADLVVGNTGKTLLVQRILQARGENRTPYATDAEMPLPPGTLTHTRTMVKIQEGCNQVCAYCVVPRVRGRERSIPLEALLREVRQRVGEGYLEVVLTGTQPGTYGFDLPDANLALLLSRILSETGVERLRVSSLQPQEVTPSLLRLWEDPRLCPHFHLPLQSGCDETLRRMRRRYTTQLYAQVVAQIRALRPEAAVTTDVIVGFPGETEGEFEESLAFCQRTPFAAIHLFPYSSRPGTSAAYLKPQVDTRVKGRRMVRMLELARQKASQFRRRHIGKVRPVLWESPRQENGRRVYARHTANYLETITESPIPLTNRVTPARLVREQGHTLYATVEPPSSPAG